MARSKVGGVAAMVSAVAFVVITAMTVWAAIVAEDNGENDNAAFYVTWTGLTMLAAIAAAVAVYGALTGTGGLGGLLPKFAFGFAVLGALSSFMAWLWFGYGGALAIGMLLLALVLRARGFGIAGHPSLWDSAMPAGFLIGSATMFALWGTGIIEQSDEDLDWGYTIGFSIAVLLGAATMAQMGRWLRSDAPVVEAATV